MEHTGALWDAGKTLVRCLLMTDTKLILAEKMTGMNMGLNFFCIRTW